MTDRPFTVADEVNCYFDFPAEPNNVQLEAWLPGHLSPDGLRSAVAGVLAGVPAAGARRRRAAWWHARYAWQVPAGPDSDPVSVLDWRTDSELDAARTRFLSAAPELDRSPPFRLLLARGPEWDSVILNAHHAAFDGRSCVLLLRLIAERYQDDAPTGEPPAAGRGVIRPRSPASGVPASGVPRPDTGPAAGHPRPLAGRRAARIAPQHGTAQHGTAQHGAAQQGDSQHGSFQDEAAPFGYGLSLLDWPGIPARSPRDAEARVSVNDLLIAALAETVNRWNSGHGRPPRLIKISMPIDTRPAGQYGVFGNLSRLATVTVDPRQTSGVAATVAAQTGRAKDTPGVLVSPLQAAAARMPLPIPVKGFLVRLALRFLGSATCDTSLLSNLGAVTDPPAFGRLVPERLWFSPSTHMPRGLAVGAVSVGGRLQLCFRYCTALFDEAAGDAFAAAYADVLSALSARLDRPAQPGERVRADGPVPTEGKVSR